jgi:regulator of RNase E activity RraA
MVVGPHSRIADLPPTSAIADVMALHGLNGVLTPPLRPIAGTGPSLIGEALTITFSVAADGPGMSTVFEVLSGDLTGRVLILAGLDDLPGAAFGEILATAARERGAVAVLVDGAARDVSSLELVGLPVYARRTCIAGPNGTAHAVGVDVTVTIDKVTVQPGDSVVADKEGCVRVPPDVLTTIMRDSLRYAATEDRLQMQLVDGGRLDEAYAIKKSVVDDLRRGVAP